MEIFEKAKQLLAGDKPRHLSKDGPAKDWKAAEFTEEYYVDDEWIRQNTKVVE